MPRLNLTGMGVALVTPFTPDGAVDFAALARLIDYQTDSGADYLVVLGTTSEAPTLSRDEQDAIRLFAMQRTAGRVPLVLGCSANCTDTLVRNITSTDLTGYSAILSVVPFYNRPSQEGIYAHYAALAQASPIPLVLYNVPGRTGVNMTADTTLRLASDFANIAAIKEACGTITQPSVILRDAPRGFQLISGDDSLTYPLITLGACGVISVIGNALPRQFATMTRQALDGDFASARATHIRLIRLISLLFRDGNPAGIKAALSAMGLCSETLRLPLSPVTDATRQGIRQQLDSLGCL